MMSTPTLAEVLSPYLADMRIKAANLRQSATDSRCEADRIRRTVHAETGVEARCRVRAEAWDESASLIEGWELAIATALQNVGTSTPETATPEPTGPERVNPLGGSPQEQGSLDAGACELCTPMDGDCLNAGCNQVRELKEDAARYVWLRDQFEAEGQLDIGRINDRSTKEVMVNNASSDNHINDPECSWPVMLDEAIDAARAKEKGTNA